MEWRFRGEGKDGDGKQGATGSSACEAGVSSNQLVLIRRGVATICYGQKAVMSWKMDR